MSGDPHQEGRKKVALPARKVPPLRILQVLVAAAGGLLFLKVTGLATHGGYIFAGQNSTGPQPEFARVLSNIRRDPSDDNLITGSAGGNKDEGKKGEDKELKMPTDFKPSGKPLPPPASPSELQVLQRLRERRDSLDKQSQELEMRETLLKAAEKKFEDKLDDGKGQAAPGAPSDPQKAAEDNKQMKSLVIIYESMKPKDAARVFDKLDMKVLISVVNAMNPRKVSEIVAAMSPDVAQKLTVALATHQDDPDGARDAGDVPPSGELPRVDLPPRPRAP